MPKTLTANNLLQKSASVATITFLLEIDRDNPDTGVSPLYICSWSGGYTIGGHVYTDRVMHLNDIRMAIPAGGGISIVSDHVIDIQNPENAVDGGGHYSDMLDAYDLENDTLNFAIVFCNGSEVAGDILTLFGGQIQDVEVSTEIMRLTSKDGSRSALKTIPQDLADFLEFPNVPINNVNLPIPLAFGNLNVEPWNAASAAVRLAPCVAVDTLASQKYTSGRLNSAYGQPYTFYRTAGYYGKIMNYTQTGAFFTVDSSARLTKISPIRALGTNDVTTWSLAVDGVTATGAAIINGSNLDLSMRGFPKLGTLTAISIEITATGGYTFTAKKVGESNVTGSTTGSHSISLASWSFLTNWDFENIELYIDGTGTATIWEVVLQVAFNEQESGDKLAFPIFQAVTGYADVAAQYQDGSVIVSANQVLTNPIDILLVMFRDKRTGMRIPTAQIYTTNLAAERAKIAGWKFDFSLTGPMDTPALDEFLRETKIRLFRTYDNLWKISVFDKSDPPTNTFTHETNITVQNPASSPPDHKSNFNLTKTPLSEIFNEFIIQYGWDPALGVYTQILIESPYYRSTGTGTMTPTSGTQGFLTDASAHFITDGIQPGYRAFVVRDKGYTVLAVPDEHTLELQSGSFSSRSDTYYVGPNFNFQCFRSSARYKCTNRKTISSRYLWDDATAQAIIDDEVDYWTTRRYIVTFRTHINDAPDAELGDLIFVDHPDMPPRKRPILISSLAAPALSSSVTLTLDSATMRLIRHGDYIVLKSATGILKAETVLVTAIDIEASTITVMRAQAGTLAKTWLTGDLLYRAITKFEITQIVCSPGTTDPTVRYGAPEFEITALETPRFYSPVGMAAPNGTPPFSSCTAEQIAASGFATWPDGTANWLDEESSVSYART